MTEETTFALAPTNTIQSACELAEQVGALLHTGGDVVIDAGKVDVADITLVQILLAARRTATAIGCRYSIINPSPAFVALLHRCGVCVIGATPETGKIEVIR